MKILLKISFLTIFILPAWGAMQCKNGNDYLESTIKNFKNANPSFYGADLTSDCRSELPLPSPTERLNDLIISVDPLYSCMGTSMNRAIVKSANLISPKYATTVRHYVDCSSGSPQYSYKGNAAGAISERKQEYDFQLADCKKANKSCDQHGPCRAAKKLYLAQKERPVDKNGNTDLPLERPCLSKNYQDFVYRSFKTAANCLEFSEKEMREYFMVVNHESSFMINVANDQGTTGIAQLTTDGIAEVNDIWGERYELNGHTRNRKDGKALQKLIGKNEYCSLIPKTLSSPFEVPKNGFVGKCDRAQIPANPLKSFIYGMILHSHYRSKAEDLYTKMFASSFNGHASIPSEDREKIIAALTIFMYNGGPSIKGVALKFIAQKSWNGLDKVKVSHDYFKEKFGSYLAAHYPSKHESRRQEVATYYQDMLDDAKRVEKQLSEKVECAL